MEMRMKLNEMGRYIDKMIQDAPNCKVGKSSVRPADYLIKLIEWLLSLFHHMHAVVVGRQVKRFICCKGKCCRYRGIP